MDHIRGALENTRRNIELVGADPATRHGFTMVPNFILTNMELSFCLFHFLNKKRDD